MYKLEIPVVRDGNPMEFFDISDMTPEEIGELFESMPDDGRLIAFLFLVGYSMGQYHRIKELERSKDIYD